MFLINSNLCKLNERNFKHNVQDEMYGKLPFKTIKVACAGNKKRRVGKPWWSDRLSVLWNTLCKAEKDWIDCKNRALKTQLKLQYAEIAVCRCT